MGQETGIFYGIAGLLVGSIVISVVAGIIGGALFGIGTSISPIRIKRSR